MTFDQALSSVKGMAFLCPDISFLRRDFQERFPHCIRALKIIDERYRTPRRKKGYGLTKRENKKKGFVYYVRYMDEGRMLPSMWCTHTNVLEEAQAFARENRDRIVNEYKANHRGLSVFFDTLEKYFQKGSKYLKADGLRNRSIGEHQRRIYYNFVKNRFVPYLKEKGIYAARDINESVISGLQNRLLEEGLKPQTINDYFSGIKRICAYFINNGMIKENPFNNVKSLIVRSKDRKMRGCHELSKLNGVFNAEWEDGYSELLTLLIYTTDMRNSELERIKMTDVERIEDCRFIKIKQSKSQNGIRLAPLHEFVYERILKYAREKGLKEDDYLILKRTGKRLQSSVYRRANIELGRRLGMSEEELTKENLTFYSGRHFWKTLMNSEGLGSDIEEVFMGHKVSGDVAKRYNHKDKRGKERMLESARNVYKILDENLFGKK
jgi:integrase/recombinase XerD